MKTFLILFLSVMLFACSNSALDQKYLSDDMIEQLTAIESAKLLSDVDFERLSNYCFVADESLKEGKTYTEIWAVAKDANLEEMSLKIGESADMYNNRLTGGEDSEEGDADSEEEKSEEGAESEAAETK